MSTTVIAERHPETEEQIISHTEKRAADIIRNATLGSAATGLIPINGLDVAASAAVQTVMIRELCQVYEVNFQDNAAETFLYSVVGSSVARVLSAVVSSFVPGTTGNINLTNIAISGIYTAAVGEFYHNHFKRGGDLNNISLEEFTDFFIDEVKNGDISVSTLTNPTSLLRHLF